MRSSSPLRTSLSKRRSALAKHLPKALTGDSLAVHQARVASRRLRETLPVVGADLNGSKAGKSARKTRNRMRSVTRALGPVRELEVTLGMIAPPAAAAKKDPTGLGRAHVAAMLRRDLDKARERLAGELDAGKIEDWLAQMEEIEGAIDPVDGGAAGQANATKASKATKAAKAAKAAQALKAAKTGKAAKGAKAALAALASGRGAASVRTHRVAPGTKWRAELADRLDTRAANLKKALDEAGLLFVSERLHEVRIALKRLRYALELAGELRVASTAAAVRDLKAVQDTLGTLHDHDVLIDYTNSAAAQPGLTRPTRASLTALNISLDRTRHELHAQFLAARPSLDRVHDRAIDVATRARAHARARAAR